MKTIKMTNMEIYNKATLIASAFQGDTTSYPVKVNFFLQKNMDIVTNLAKDIETARLDIVKKYGEPVEGSTDQVTIPQDKMDIASREMEDLFSIEQDVSFNPIKLDWFDGINLPGDKVAAISYMIEEE